MAYQSHLSGSGLPDLNAMLFPSPDLFNFVPHHMDPAVQHYSKNNANNQLNPSPMFLSNNGTNPFGNLEGTILGPLPPYLLQGQQQQGDTIMTGQDVSMDGQVGQGDVPGQYFMGNGGGDAMVPDFFRDEWDDALMQQTFRAA